MIGCSEPLRLVAFGSSSTRAPATTGKTIAMMACKHDSDALAKHFGADNDESEDDDDDDVDKYHGIEKYDGVDKYEGDRWVLELGQL